MYCTTLLRLLGSTEGVDCVVLLWCKALAKSLHDTLFGLDLHNVLSKEKIVRGLRYLVLESLQLGNLVHNLAFGGGDGLTPIAATQRLQDRNFEAFVNSRFSAWQS